MHGTLPASPKKSARAFPPLILRLAFRELRAGLRGFGIFLACIALGVAAIAGVSSLSRSLTDGIGREGRRILGGDMAFSLLQREANAQEKAFLASKGQVNTIASMRAMVLAGERTIAEVCVVADSTAPVTPCGGCRQRLAEFGTPGTRIHAADCHGVRRTFTLAEILPAGFALEGSG